MLVAAAVFAALGVLLIVRRSTWARDVVQLHWFSQRTSERVIVGLGVSLLAAAAVAVVAAVAA